VNSKSPDRGRSGLVVTRIRLTSWWLARSMTDTSSDRSWPRSPSRRRRVVDVNGLQRRSRRPWAPVTVT
jgi:hypothetical protein